MKTLWIVCFVVIAVCKSAGAEDLKAAYGRLPLAFEANEGQTDRQVKFLARTPGTTLFLTPTETVLVLRGPHRAAHREPEQTVVRMKLLGASSGVRVEGVDELSGRINYFVGREPEAWRRDIRTFARARYRGVYPGIDLLYYGNDGDVEYDFVVAPGASPASIRLSLEGATLALDGNGDLVGRVEDGELRMRKPVLYQEAEGVQISVPGAWVLRRNGHAQFEVGEYDTTKPLVIDPVLSYSTYLGGSSTDSAEGIAADAAGDVYVTGWASSTNFPTTAGALKRTRGATSSDVFVTKLDPTGSMLVYSTYLGGNFLDLAGDIAVDASGNAYVVGTTYSADFPTSAGALQSSLRGERDAFVAKLNPSGSALVYSTYLGGNGEDSSWRIAVDAAGRAHITGPTMSFDFPTTAGAVQPSFGGGLADAFVAKLDATGSALVFSTYLGGSFLWESGTGIAVDAGGNVYVAGFSDAADFPTTPGAFQTGSQGAADVFVTKLDPTGTMLLYSTYIGGGISETAFDLTIDRAGNAYVTGETFSTNFPVTAGVHQTTYGGGTSDMFVTKLNPTGSALVFSTYLGGSGSERAYNVGVDALGNVYLAGGNELGGFPTTADALYPTPRGGLDAVVAQLNPSGSELLYSTYLGGSREDFALSMAFDAARNVYVVGYTGSRNFPVTTGAFQTAWRGGTDGFVTKISGLVPAAPSVGKVTGGGTVRVTDGRATFAFVVQRKKTIGAIAGNLHYVNHATGARLRARTFTSLTIAGDQATIEGTCTINQSPCTFMVTVTDRGEPGQRDSFVISVASAPPEGGVLRSGNIKIRD